MDLVVCKYKMSLRPRFWFLPQFTSNKKGSLSRQETFILIIKGTLKLNFLFAIIVAQAGSGVKDAILTVQLN